MTIHVALAGAGAFGIKHLDAIKLIPDVKVISVVGREYDKTQLPEPQSGYDDGTLPDAPFHGDDAALPGEGPENGAVNQ